MLHESVVGVSRVQNESMLPYLKPGDWVLYIKWQPCVRIPFTQVAFACSPCVVGHAYIFAEPKHRRHKLVKFAAAEIENRQSADYKRDIISFTQHKAMSAHAPLVNSCYFLGGNLENSIDSRSFGRIPLDAIEGEVVYPRIVMPR